MISFRAACTKGLKGAGEFDRCDLVFEGLAGVEAYVEHMTKVHGLKFTNPPKASAFKPSTWRPSKSGCLPPAGKRRDAFMAALEIGWEES
jgi:hypothetical protein